MEFNYSSSIYFPWKAYKVISNYMYHLAISLIWLYWLVNMQTRKQTKNQLNTHFRSRCEGVTEPPIFLLNLALTERAIDIIIYA